MANLSEYLKLRSAALRLESESIRQIFQNSTNKGSGFEDILREQISTFLPPHWRVTHGEIVDSVGNQTGQIDIAIVNELHPRGYTNNRPEIVMYDATVAIGEAKLLLTTKELDSAYKIAQQISKLALHQDNNNPLSSEIRDTLTFPPFLLIALRSNVSSAALAERLCNDIFQCVIIFDDLKGKSMAAVSDTVASQEAIKFLSSIGQAANGTQRVFTIDNPLLALSWLVTTYSVPMLALTPVIPMYY